MLLFWVTMWSIFPYLISKYLSSNSCILYIRISFGAWYGGEFLSSIDPQAFRVRTGAHFKRVLTTDRSLDVVQIVRETKSSNLLGQHKLVACVPLGCQSWHQIVNVNGLILLGQNSQHVFVQAQRLIVKDGTVNVDQIDGIVFHGVVVNCLVVCCYLVVAWQVFLVDKH
ncbi:hypothetical protein BpHYR1_011324 [Brachionus plicatilis]|uniref:Uncharacterized protein n=1 Tax=Brachionus plicatilis TaxID=10195 RepID=A0A3M7Q1G0_BRAPC|nr:hypothetical protein BpHYR1_011324 [Brachionus plicatilis]